MKHNKRMLQTQDADEEAKEELLKPYDESCFDTQDEGLVSEPEMFGFSSALHVLNALGGLR
jgi:hypothetical protein